MGEKANERKQMIKTIIEEIKYHLKQTAPELTADQKKRRKRILNPDSSKFFGYGHKMAELEKIARNIQQKFECSYDDALQVFQTLIKSNIHEEKFMGVLFLNRFKRDFDKRIVNLFFNLFPKYCNTWALCDSSMIKVVGPFLAKKTNKALLTTTIKKWATHKNLWIRRASMVILLKVIMLHKTFDENYVFSVVERFLPSTEDYIQKAVGWLLKTCTRYKPEVIEQFLLKNKARIPRLILRYASEKLPKEKRGVILKKT